MAHDSDTSWLFIFCCYRDLKGITFFLSFSVHPFPILEKLVIYSRISSDSARLLATRPLLWENFCTDAPSQTRETSNFSFQNIVWYLVHKGSKGLTPYNPFSCRLTRGLRKVLRKATKWYFSCLRSNSSRFFEICFFSIRALQRIFCYWPPSLRGRLQSEKRVGKSMIGPERDWFWINAIKVDFESTVTLFRIPIVNRPKITIKGVYF